MLQPFLIAVQFLTRLPVTRGGWPERDVGCSIVFYPAVGLLIGLLLAALGYIMMDVRASVAAAILLAAWVAITGALHLDGLADSADAWVGGFGDRERTLAIMKDPYCGPVAVVVLAVVLILKFAALEGLVHKGAWLALVVAPLLGRTAVPVLFLTTPYVRPGGLGTALATHMPRRAAGGASVAAIAAALLIVRVQGLWMLVAAGLVFALLRLLAIKRIGGITGDVVGAAIELTECAALVAASLA